MAPGGLGRVTTNSSSANPKTVYLGLGSNLGCRKTNLDQALEHIRRLPRSQSQSVQETRWARVTRSSSIYETQPWGYAGQGPFLNQVLEVETTVSAQCLLYEVKAAEETMGRVPSVRYGPRAIDIDILLYGDEVIDRPDLQVPHPRLHQRAFVLVPLAELAPDLIHPTLGISVGHLCGQVEGKQGVKWWGRSMF